MKLPIYLYTYNSPFKTLKLKWYFGKVAKPVPYFLPRKWVKYTYEDALEKTREHLKKHPQSSKLIPFDKLVDSYKNYSKAIPRKIGFDFIELGWKTKYNSYRFEFSPIWSFVCFGYQIAVTFVAPHLDRYWECFLYYSRDTDKSKSRKERIKQARIEFPCRWITYTNGVEENICYWDLILRDKYLK